MYQLFQISLSSRDTLRSIFGSCLFFLLIYVFPLSQGYTLFLMPCGFVVLENWKFKSYNVVTIEIGLSPIPREERSNSLLFSICVCVCVCVCVLDCCRPSSCPGSDWGINLGSLWSFSSLYLSLGMQSDCLNFPVMRVAFSFFQLCCNTVDILHRVSVSCIAYWFDIYASWNE